MVQIRPEIGETLLTCSCRSRKKELYEKAMEDKDECLKCKGKNEVKEGLYICVHGKRFVLT